MSGCERALDLIGLRLDGPLSPEEQRKLDAHLEQCPACRAAARELEELEGALVQLGECDPPPQLVSGVMERVRADSAPAKVVPLWKRPAFRGALGMAACAALCIGLLPQMAGLSSGGGNSTGAAPASASESQAASSTPAAGAYAAGGESSPSTEVRSSNAGRPEAEDTAPMEAESPASIAPFSLQEQGAGAPEDFSALAPALSEDLAGQLGQSPGRLLLFSTIPEELEDRDWQETDGFRWTALEAEGDHSLLDALTAQAAALWESGAEGPAVALGVSLNPFSALTGRDLRPVQGSFLLFFVESRFFFIFVSFTSATKKRLSDVHFYDIIANSRSPRHGGFRLGSLYESVQT